MRALPWTIALLLLLPLGLNAGQIPGEVGDPPRTFSHFLNAREAALCRASAATGGVESFFLNPACASTVREVSGQATVRLVSTSRDDASVGGEDADASDGAFLMPQIVAMKRSGNWVLGFAYSAPVSRDLEIEGTIGSGSGQETYEGRFQGGLRYFETVLATRVGKGGRGGFGIAVGFANLSESVREVVGESLDSADVGGTSSSLAAGFVYEASDRVTLGAGYRWGSNIDVEGEWYGQQGATGRTKTQPVTVAGITVRPNDHAALHACYTVEGWNEAESSLSAYGEDDGRRDEFGEAVATAAAGAEASFMRDRLWLRAGGSMRLEPEEMDGGLPQWSAGVGCSYAFTGYSVDAAVVRERCELDGGGGRIASYGAYLTVSYDF
jgi:hypothetical protein